MSLTVTLLTGRRPILLGRTLEALRAHHEAVMGDAFILVLHNGGDVETSMVLEKYHDLISLRVVSDRFLNLGAATSLLFDHAVQTGSEYLLHLEDDWEATPGLWYDQAARLLDDGTFQVRLRHTDERVLPDHMVSKRPLRWTFWPDGYRTCPDAHYTLNPSLIRLDDIRLGWPAADERSAQRRFWKAGKRRVAQLVPGVWRHTGGVHSLRRIVEGVGT